MYHNPCVPVCIPVYVYGMLLCYNPCVPVYVCAAPTRPRAETASSSPVSTHTNDTHTHTHTHTIRLPTPLSPSCNPLPNHLFLGAQSHPPVSHPVYDTNPTTPTLRPDDDSLAHSPEHLVQSTTEPLGGNSFCRAIEPRLSHIQCTDQTNHHPTPGRPLFTWRTVNSFCRAIESRLYHIQCTNQNNHHHYRTLIVFAAQSNPACIISGVLPHLKHPHFTPGRPLFTSGEDCDDTTGCCDLTTCTLRRGATCTWDIEDSCCTYVCVCVRMCVCV
jgi:hypothetical protein